ncbi:lipin, N-terminal conserved region-domain-containing protein, partial [Syncephalis pseudoplumigaleata]
MNFVTRALSSVTEFYKDLNPATLSGAIDVIVLEQPNGELSCTPFHVRFGKLRLLRPQDKVVEVRVNGELTDFQMKLGDQGEAFFVVASETPVPAEYTTSPIAGPMTMEDEPDFLDLEANMGYRSDHADGERHDQYDEDDDQDGYVSAHSAQESDLEPMPAETTVHMTTPAIDDASPQRTEADEGYHNKEPKKYDWPQLTAQARRAFTTHESYQSPRQLEEQGAATSGQEGASSPATAMFDETAAAASPAAHEFQPLSDDQWHWNWGQLPERMGGDDWHGEQATVKPVQYTPHSFVVDGVQHTFELSLCDIHALNEDERHNEMLFNEHIIDYDTFQQHPALLYDHRMVVRYNGRYYSWLTAAPVIMSLLVFQRALPEETV